MAVPQLIQSTDLTGVYTLSIGTDTLQSAMFDEVCMQKQTTLLKQCLGAALYNELAAESWTGTTPTTQKWIDFIDGSTYTYNNVTIDWLGFKDLLIPFIYYCFKRATITTETNAGTVIQRSENSFIKQNFMNVSTAYNDASEKVGIDYLNVFDPKSKFRYRYSPIPFSTDRTPLIDKALLMYEPTLYNFITHTNEATPNTFENWRFEALDTITMYGF